MECQEARERYVEALAAGRVVSDELDRHIVACPPCQEEVRGLAEAWGALAALPLAEPGPEAGRRLRWAVRREVVRDGLASIEAWQRAALAGVASFVLSVVLSFLVPYQTMVAICEAIAPPGFPTPAAYLGAGLLYGLLPMLVGTALERRTTPGFWFLGTFEALIVFLVVLVPYVVLRCGEFPLPLLAGFIGGIALGAGLGGVVGTGLGRRHALGF